MRRIFRSLKESRSGRRETHGVIDWNDCNAAWEYHSLHYSLAFARHQRLEQLESLQWLTRLEKAQMPAQAMLAQNVLPRVQVESMIAESDDLVRDASTLQQHTHRFTESDRYKAEQLVGQLLSLRARVAAYWPTKRLTASIAKQFFPLRFAMRPTRRSLLAGTSDQRITASPLKRSQ